VKAGRLRSLLLRLSKGFYRVALHRYPARLRRRYGARMLEDFSELLEEETRRDGLRGWGRACSRVLRDLARPTPGPLRTAPGRRVPEAAGRRGGRIRTVAEDARAAWRALRRRPGFASLVVAILGAGLALDTTMFAVVDAYLLRALPFPAPSRLVEVRPATAAVGWEDSEDVFEKAVSWNLDAFTLVGDPAPQIVLGARVSPDFFDTYGVRPTPGRAFRADEGGEGGASVAVISHRLWKSRFGGDPGILGRTVRAYRSDEANGLESFTIVGVLPADFWYLNGYTDVLTPLRGPGPVYVARLRTDVPPSRGEAILTARALEAGDLEGGQGGIRLRPLQDAYAASVRPQLLAMQVAALLVLLAAVASVGLLVLVRANGRRREMAVRRALGAGRARLATQLFAEGAILVFVAAALGMAAGGAGLNVLGSVIEARIGRAVPGGVASLRLDGTVAGAAIVLGILMVFVLGSVSLWATTHRSLARVTAGGGRGAIEPAGSGRSRAVLVAAEVALSLTLLCGGALLVRSALHLQGMELGFEPTGLETYTVGLTSEGAEDPVRRASFFGSLLQAATTLPGVESAGLVRSAPFGGRLTARRIEAEGRPGAVDLPEAVPQIVSNGLFRTLGVASQQGRGFTQDDGPGAAPVAVVSASLAESLGQGESQVLGRRIRFSAWTMPDMEERTGPWLTVVGVVPDVADGLPGSRPTVYVPYTQAPSAWMDLVVRRRPGTPGLADRVRTLVRELDENTPIYEAADIPAAVRRARAPSRFFAALLGAFSLFSLILAMIGLYSVAAYAARQRRRDLAVRMALGARRASVEALFLRDASGAVASGLVVGLVGGRALGHVLAGQLHGIRPDDVVTALAAATLVGATALLAVWLPARGASRLEVSTILREE
jgi:putative ABC transport system permease protein